MGLHKRTVFPLTLTFFKVAALYRAAFPADERLPLWQLWINGLRKNQAFSAYYDEDDFVGFTYTIQDEAFVFLLFLAVDGRHRSKGYGSLILKDFAQAAGSRPCVLTVEPMDETDAPNFAQRLKRLAFYEANGYIAMDHYYYEGPARYQILSTDLSLSLSKLESGLEKTFLGRYGIRLD